MNAASKDTGTVLIHGKAYQTVAYRVSQFREKHPGFSLLTESLQRDEACVVMKATILDETGRVIATGHAEEYRSSSQINKTSALENAETSAIGRCLAAFGLGGTEFASADEVAHVVSGGKPGVHKPTDGALASLSKERMRVVTDTATQVIDAIAENRDFDAYALCESFKDADEKVGLWSLLDSKQRSRIKKQAEAEKQKGAQQWKESVGAS